MTAPRMEGDEQESLHELALALVRVARRQALGRVRVTCADGSIVDVIVLDEKRLCVEQKRWPAPEVASVRVATEAEIARPRRTPKGGRP